MAARTISGSRARMDEAETEKILAQPAHLALDPLLDLAVELLGRELAGVDRGAYAHRDRAGVLQERVAPPVLAGIVRNRHDRRCGLGGEPRAARLVLGTRAGRDPRALGEDHDAVPPRQPVESLIEQLAQRAAAVAPIDGDRRQHGEAPAEERYPEELALYH